MKMERRSLNFLLLALAILLMQAPLYVKGQNNPEIEVSGTVTDESGQALAGVTVNLKGTKSSVVTTDEGTFQIKAFNGAVLILSSVGFETKEVNVSASEIAVVMRNQTAELDQVIVIGYGTTKKGDVLGAISSFDADKLNERPVGRVDQALIGQMAGVDVKQTTGIPGKGLSVQVRGTGSISAGNEPLYVIDGFPLESASPNSAGNFATGNPLDNINPNDIERIEVLKDAATAAIYGSRAANGVVLITTKQGKKGAPKFSFNIYGGYSEASRTLKVLSAEQWIDRAIEVINDQWVASGSGRLASQSNEERRQILGLAPGQVNTNYMTDDRWTQPGHPGLVFIDWQKEAFRKGLQQNYELSASGGSDAVTYYVSGNYSQQNGIMKGLGYESYSARANVDVHPNKNLHFGIKITPTYSITNDPGIDGKDNLMHIVAGFTPVGEDTMGLHPNVYENGLYRWGVSRNSPISGLEEILARTSVFRTLATIYGEYEIFSGLKFRTTLNLDNTESYFKRYIPYQITGSVESRAANLTKNTSGAYNGYNRKTFVNENTLSYSTIIGGDHDLSAIAGYSYNSNKINNYSLSSKDGFGSSVVTTLNAANAVSGSTSESMDVLLSYFGRIQYSFKDKYLFSSSLRRDGSSRFGINSKWGWFPSASIGWRISKESFMDNTRGLISDLKIRASWGRAGNYNIGDYSSIPVLGQYNYSFGGGSAVGQAPSRIVVPDLTWEKSNTVNAGVDFGLWNNRLTGSFDYYRKSNTALLLNIAIPEATGFNTMLGNTGDVLNKGWEIQLSSRNTNGLLRWSTNVNFSHNTNKVQRLPDGQTLIYVPSAFDISHSVLQVGLPMYSINVVRQIGILSQKDIDDGAALFGSQTVGDPKYFDANHDGVIDADDRVIVGHPNPDYLWGITNSFSYKGFDLSILVQGQWGGSIYSLFGRAVNRTGTGVSDNVIETWADRWRSPDDPGNGEVGKAYSTFGRIKNTDWLYPSDYIRVRNITLGYDLMDVIKADFIKGFRVYVTAENFWGHDKYVGGYNPEATNTNLSGSSIYPEPGDYGGMPIPRSLIVGLNITF